MIDEQRPQLTPELTSAELRRWYWLKDELAAFARRLGIRATGGKEVLTLRIAAELDGSPFIEPKAVAAMKRVQLRGPLASTSVIPEGQRCSQVVRAWFIEQVGASFSFDARMREFFSQTDGTQTLADALEHYRSTRDGDVNSIDRQFEYNRFTRSWYAANPGGLREDLLRDWHEYRRLPLDQRGRA